MADKTPTIGETLGHIGADLMEMKRERDKWKSRAERLEKERNRAFDDIDTEKAQRLRAEERRERACEQAREWKSRTEQAAAKLAECEKERDASRSSLNDVGRTAYKATQQAERYRKALEPLLEACHQAVATGDVEHIDGSLLDTARQALKGDKGETTLKDLLDTATANRERIEKARREEDDGKCEHCGGRVGDTPFGWGCVNGCLGYVGQGPEE
jgi:chromosome segregation ATPase